MAFINSAPHEAYSELTTHTDQLFERASGAKPDHGVYQPLDSIATAANLAAIISREHKARLASYQNVLHDIAQGRSCAQSLARDVDYIISKIFRVANEVVYPIANSTVSEGVAIVATGGFGRGLLAPYSDIDLLFLLPFKESAYTEQISEFMYQVLWDSGFETNANSRNLLQCISYAKREQIVATSLLTSRWITGNRTLFNDLQLQLRMAIEGELLWNFLNDKHTERRARRIKEGGSSYLVEPDIKNGLGGLRDLDTILWLSQVYFDQGTLDGMGELEMFTAQEVTELANAETFLWATRIMLQLFSKNKSNRLNFSLQKQLAEHFGYKDTVDTRDVETFMRNYFRNTGRILRNADLFDAFLLEAVPTPDVETRAPIDKLPSYSNKLNRHHALTAQRLEIKPLGEQQDNATHVMGLFLLMARERLWLHPRTFRFLKRNSERIAKDFAHSQEAKDIFLDILAHSPYPHIGVRAMISCGILMQIIPEFEAVRGLMQFNNYHHYTVDEHLTRSLRELGHIKIGELKESLPLATRLLPMVSHQRALALAVFLHDIAKGQPEDHSILGAKLIAKIAQCLGMTKPECDLATWLVRNHLVLSITAQTRDLTDQKTISNLAELCGSLEYLRCLLILTVCDIRAVGPLIWTDWKAQLLRDAYNETELMLSGNISEETRDKRIKSKRDRAAAGLKDLLQSEPDTYVRALDVLARFSDSYLIRSQSEEILMHIQQLLQYDQTKQPQVTPFPNEHYHATNISIVARDRPGLLFQVAEQANQLGVNIIGAQIETLDNGTAVDTIILKHEYDDPDAEHRRATRISAAIAGVLIQQSIASQILPPPTEDLSNPFDIDGNVWIDNDQSEFFTVIECRGPDSTGLLARSMHAISLTSDLDLRSAHVAVFGARFVNVFYVSRSDGSKVPPSEHKFIAMLMRRAIFGEGN